MLPTNEKTDAWKTQTYTLGALAGMFFGLITAYLFSRATEEETGGVGRPGKVKTMRLMTVSLAALKLMRQITELSKDHPEES